MDTAKAILLAFAFTLPAQADAQDTASRSRVIAAAKDVMQVARFATFVTIGEDGHPQARIVDPFAPDSDLTVWIATNPLTRKVSEIRRDARVTLLYFNTAAQEFVTLQGTANLVSDSVEKAKRWKPEWAPLFKQGPRGEGYLLVRIRPTQLEVVSARHGMMNDPRTWRPVIIRFP